MPGPRSWLRALVPEVLRTEPQFRLLFGGQVLSLVGDRVMLVALPFAVGMSAIGVACALAFLSVRQVRDLPRAEAPAPAR
jgi:hypothetical protein